MSLSRTSSITRSNSTRSTTAPSNIRVFVKWHDQTVFAGEDVKCTITFKNIASVGGLPQQHQPPPRTPRQAANSDRLRQAGKQTATTTTGLHPPTPRGHRSGFASPRGRPSQPLQAAVSSHPRDGRGHRKSVSIVSIGTKDDVSDPHGSGRVGRFNRGHGRASSLQIMSLPHSSDLRTQSASQSPRTSSSPLFSPTIPPTRYARPTGASTVPNTPSVLNPRSSPRQPASGIPDFRFPAVQSPVPYNDPSETHSDDAVSPGEPPVDLPTRPKPPQQPVPTINEQHATPSARILSTTSIGTGTPRSSGEFYSLSNNSSETLASEYVTQQPPRAAGGRPHLRLLSNFSQQHLQQLQQQARAPESLMMGYAQLQGSFTLDGSLVDLAPFESVKKKAVVGGQGGGGVVGVEAGAKRDSGLLGGFGWGAISNSLGELLGGGELSSIREMRGIASSRAVPLLSMPQSILFVDMQLAPGESKSFEYEFRLPRGLPPSHKGRAMKISYSLVIGTQRPGGGKEQKVRSVEVPFRVLGSVNSHGEILGHDLMSPYIILKDQARVRPVTPPATAPTINGTNMTELAKGQAGHATTTGGNSSTVDDFLNYVGELLSQQRNGHGSGLLSPTAMPSSRRPSFAEEHAARTAKEAIDMAILRSNVAAGAGQGSPNRFQIARNGRRVAVVVLTRPAYRLGEVVTLAVDFSGSEVPCYAVHAALETAERVDAGLSVRSEASVHRVTRKVFVEGSEGCMFSRRSVFRAAIPVGATPEFVTSGVGLEWKVRLEFVVPGSVASEDGRVENEDEDEDGGGGGEGEGKGKGKGKGHPLLEEVSRDEKGGLVLVAVENVSCESFEVAVPLRVYGAVGKGLERLERDDASENGLAV